MPGDTIPRTPTSTLAPRMAEIFLLMTSPSVTRPMSRTTAPTCGRSSELVVETDQLPPDFPSRARSEHREGREGLDDVAGEVLVADDVVAKLVGIEPGAEAPAHGGG